MWAVFLESLVSLLHSKLFRFWIHRKWFTVEFNRWSALPLSVSQEDRGALLWTWRWGYINILWNGQSFKWLSRKPVNNIPPIVMLNLNQGRVEEKELRQEREISNKSSICIGYNWQSHVTCVIKDLEYHWSEVMKWSELGNNSNCGLD